MCKKYVRVFGSTYPEGHHPESHYASFPPYRPIYLYGRFCHSVLAVVASMLMNQREEPDVSLDAEHKTRGAAAGGWTAARQWARLPPLGLLSLGPSPSPRSRAPLARPGHRAVRRGVRHLSGPLPSLGSQIATYAATQLHGSALVLATVLASSCAVTPDGNMLTTPTVISRTRSSSPKNWRNFLR